MKRISAIKSGDVIRPDWPTDQNWPPNDANIEGVTCNGDEYIIYETGDELPEAIRPKLHVLRDLPDDLLLWRYLDFPRLYSLVRNKALYFTPGYVLRDLEPYELRAPVRLVESNRSEWIRAYEQQFPGDTEGSRLFDSTLALSEDSLLYGLGFSCWHINEVENNGLWQVFVPNGGVAIKTSLGRLKNSLDCRKRYISADTVEYIDHRISGYQPHPSAIGFEQIYHKATFFEYEKEFRLAYRFDRDLREFTLSDSAVKAMSPREIEVVEQHLKCGTRCFLANRSICSHRSHRADS